MNWYLVTLVTAMTSTANFTAAQQGEAVSITIPTDSASCTWRGGDFGDVSQCFSDEVPVGSCGSGADADCANPDRNEDEYDMIRCCRLQNYRYESCTIQYADYGENLSCLGNEDSVEDSIVEAICGSGRDDDCNGSSHMISCCVGTFLTGDHLYSGGTCEWQYAYFGYQLHCRTDSQAIFGRCGSGRDPDCNGSKDYHGIQCCDLIRF